VIRYTNNKGGTIRSVEIVDRPEHLQIYIQLNKTLALNLVEDELGKLGYTIQSQAMVKGQPMLVAIGPRIEPQLISHLSVIGGPLTPAAEKKPFDAWKIRSLLGFGGQTLQLASSIMKNKVDGPLLLFASTNLAANTINLVYKGQKRDDPHQMHLLKTEINQLVSSRLPEQRLLPDINDNRSLLREHIRDNAPHPAHHFMQRYSVNVGELGLRYIGAFGMAFPASDWKAAMSEGRLPMTNKASPVRTFTGLASILGKTVATTAKVPDPYNPAPHSKLDEIREKYSFLGGGLIEAGAFSALAYDAYTNSSPVMRNGTLDTSRSIKFGGKYHRDWLSATGAALFVGGYIVRSWAKYGERRVDMHEVYAHASDAIALLPQEQIPQAIADVSAYLANHFKGKTDPKFGEIYNKISDDLSVEHHITLIQPAKAGKATAPSSPVPPIPHAPASTISTREAVHQPLQNAPEIKKIAL
jgi:hypothetical protein